MISAAKPMPSQPGLTGELVKRQYCNTGSELASHGGTADYNKDTVRNGKVVLNKYQAS
jgi:hypothetical protein